MLQTCNLSKVAIPIWFTTDGKESLGKTVTWTVQPASTPPSSVLLPDGLRCLLGRHSGVGLYLSIHIMYGVTHIPLLRGQEFEEGC